MNRKKSIWPIWRLYSQTLNVFIWMKWTLCCKVYLYFKKAIYILQYLASLVTHFVWGPEQSWSGLYYSKLNVSIVAQMVKNLPVIQETGIWWLGWEDPLEKEMATHFIVLAWKIPWTAEPGGPWPMRSQRVGHNWATNTHTHKLNAQDFTNASVHWVY